MAVALQSGFPVVASKAQNGTLTLTTPSHSTTGACKLVLCLSAEDSNGAITNTAITDNAGGVIGTWTRLISKKWTGTSFDNFGWSEVWVADCSATYTSKTVTLTVTTPAATMFAAMALFAVTGFDAGDPFGAEDSGAATSDGATHLIAGALTAETTDGMIFGTGLNGNSTAAFTAQTGTTIDVTQSDAGAGSRACAFHKTATTTASNAYTVGTTATDNYWGYAVVEVRAAGSGVTGTSAVTLANSTQAASGTHGVTGTSTPTLAADVQAASGTHGVTGSSSATLAGSSHAATGTQGVTGSSAIVLAASVAAAAGTHGVTGTSSSTLAASTHAASGTVAGGPVTGTSAAVLANDVHAASGMFGSFSLPVSAATGQGSAAVVDQGRASAAVVESRGTTSAEVFPA